jgi:hypothetical protein
MSRQIKTFIIYFLIFSGAISLNASQVEIINSSANSLQINYNPALQGFTEYSDDNGNTTYKPIIANTIIEETETGFPSVLVYSEIIIVPGPDKFYIKNVEVNSVNSYNKKIIPTPEYDYSKFAINYNPDYSKYYEKRTIEPVELNYLGISRGNHIAELRIKAAYNNKGYIEIPESVMIDIAFDAANTYKRTNNSNMEYFTALNHFQADLWNIETNNNKFLSEDYANISSGNWYKIVIPEEGVYRISGSQLSGLGIPNNSETASSLKIFGYGGKNLSQNVTDGINNELPEQEIIVNTNTDGSVKEVIFYAAGTTGFEYKNNKVVKYNNIFSDYNAYILTYGGRNGIRAEARTSPQGVPGRTLTKYTERILFEEELQCPYPLGGGTQWFGKSYIETPFINKLHNLDRSGEVLFRTALAHSSPDAPALYEIKENSVKIGDIYLNSTPYEYTHAYREVKDFRVPASSIADDNRSRLEFIYNNNSVGGYTNYLDYFEIHYPRTMLAIDNELKMFTAESLEGITEFSANGFSGEIYGFDITDLDSPKLLKNDANTGGMFVFKDSTHNPEKQYFISSNLKSPELVSIDFENLRAKKDNYDVILITHKNLLESAEYYKQYREANSDLSVGIFSTEIIFNEFAATLPDITAIRDFIAYAYHNWSNKPQYVILWGDGHYDYKNINTSAVNYIPVYQSTPAYIAFSEINNDFATDDFFMRIDGNDDVADIAVGRLTINSNEEGKWIVDKINHYENNSSNDSWRTNAILLADDGPTDDSSDGPLHTTQSEKLAKHYINDSFNKDKIYMVEYERQYSGGEIRKPDVTKDILSSVNNQSGIFLNFIGHGNPGVWSHERVFERDSHIKLLTNLDKLSFLTAATCDYGRFDNPEVKTGSELFMSSKVGGAIAVFSATRVVLSQSNADLNNLLYRNIFRRKSDGSYPTLGEAMLAVKQVRNEPNDEKFFLLADPTLKLHIPEYEIIADSINGQSLEEFSEVINLKALETVTVSGTINSGADDRMINDFNGNLLLTVREGDKYFDLLEPEDPAHFLFRKHGAALNKGLFKVENGRFTAEFIIPKDISFSDSLGRMYFYSYSDDGRYAKGIFRNYTVNGVAENNYQDNEGPEIQIFLDDRVFSEGDYVREEPLLIVDIFDNTGINTTGLGIGHRIEAWINDNPLAIDLTDKFSPSLEDPRFGTAQDYIQNLESGLHRIRVRAWDIFNNYNESETFFRISDRDEGHFISELQNNPNPFYDETVISFKNNLTPPIDGKLIIYSSIGHKLEEREFILSSSLKGEIGWDAKFDDGKPVPTGVYFYNLILTDSNGKTVTKSNKMICLGN